LRGGGDLYQIDILLRRQPLSFGNRNNAELLTLFTYQAYLRSGDFPVDALRLFECYEGISSLRGNLTAAVRPFGNPIPWSFRLAWPRDARRAPYSNKPQESNKP